MCLDFISFLYAKVAQLVEHNVANVRVVGSNPIFRSVMLSDSSVLSLSKFEGKEAFFQASYPSGKGAVCKTVMHQFESGRRLF